MWKILQKENDDPVKQVYLELKRNCFEKNWTNEIMEVMHRYGLSTCDEEVSALEKLSGITRLSMLFMIMP